MTFVGSDYETRFLGLRFFLCDRHLECIEESNERWQPNICLKDLKSSCNFGRAPGEISDPSYLGAASSSLSQPRIQPHSL